VYYFAYGSNLLHQRLRARTPSATVVTTARIEGYLLRFHKIGTDGSGKCDAFQTGHSGHVVHGVIYTISDEDRRVLDRIEGVGSGYAIENVQALTNDDTVAAFTYVVQPAFIDPAMRPFHWYKRFVVMGARQNGLPEDYIAAIEEVPADPDPDRARAEKNRIIANGGAQRAN